MTLLKMTHRYFFLAIWTIVALPVLTIGCDEPDTAQNSGIINQTTNEIGEYDADGEAKEADLSVKPSAGPLAAMGTYGYMISEISKQQITRMTEMFKATHGRYPKDHDEFMKEIIDAYNIKLPVLPGSRRYQYDVENHQLLVVEAEK